MKLSNKVSARQCWLLGCWFFVFVFVALFFCFVGCFFPLSVALQIHFHWRVLRTAGRFPSSQALGGAEQFPGQVEQAAAALSEVAGLWRPGSGGGEALALEAAAVARGPFKVLQQRSEV